MARRIARFATVAGVAGGLAFVGVGAAAADGWVPTSLTEGVATAERADASVDLGGAIGNLRVPSADLTHTDAVACDRVASGCPSSGGNQSGGATEVFSLAGADQPSAGFGVDPTSGPHLSALMFLTACVGLAATAGIAQRVRGFAAVRA